MLYITYKERNILQERGANFCLFLMGVFDSSSTNRNYTSQKRCNLKGENILILSVCHRSETSHNGNESS